MINSKNTYPTDQKKKIFQILCKRGICFFLNTIFSVKQNESDSLGIKKRRSN